jgi:catechol 2,3-dioxygenase-like lactoylglutathione lyase family enzyme
MRVLCLLLALAVACPAQEPGRPRITGVAHSGIPVGSLDKANAFCRNVLGFQETWRGSRDGRVPSRANRKDPDGARTELMEPHTVDGRPVPPPPAAPPR